ncbi:MAG TPA: GNAT family N-acetyltransferase [Blastocatellia bacterium]|nr:GNAT family N-acetyltransferase [Blastocatellia bacterium]HMX29446.1 GNAT family N-acetyltransferase [Blastocatellia bacterium]HMY72377.1 GNAT family N-acetyltransferase [Blastocatellia bacterium]HMZ22184.1 GNAT family N-acetyltransferase [Blastocatellia bacterium]HNG31246.1 GNAT family N-acetyltransferase [Blastocatellia bacterium]
MQIKLRAATPEDEAFLYKLYAGTRAEELAAWGWDDAQQQLFLQLQFRGRQAHYAQYPNPDHRIILDEELPIGRLLVSRLEKEIRLVDIALLPEHRGRGIGAKLIQELLHEAARSGKVVRLHVEKFNRAQQLYGRLGFEIAGDAQTHYLMEWKSPTGEN